MSSTDTQPKEESKAKEEVTTTTTADAAAGGEKKQPAKKKAKVEDKPVPLLQRSARERKAPAQYKVEEKEEKDLVIPEGKGTKLGEIQGVAERFKPSKPSNTDALTHLHKNLFGRPGRKGEPIKVRLLKWNGHAHASKEDQEAWKQKLSQRLDALVLDDLKDICNVLNLKVGGVKEAVITRIVDFLDAPSADFADADTGGPGEKKKKTKAKASTSSKKRKAPKRKSKDSDDDDEDDDEDDDDEGGKKKKKEKSESKGTKRTRAVAANKAEKKSDKKDDDDNAEEKKGSEKEEEKKKKD